MSEKIAPGPKVVSLQSLSKCSPEREAKLSDAKPTNTEQERWQTSRYGETRFVVDDQGVCLTGVDAQLDGKRAFFDRLQVYNRTQAPFQVDFALGTAEERAVAAKHEPARLSELSLTLEPGHFVELDAAWYQWPGRRNEVEPRVHLKAGEVLDVTASSADDNRSDFAKVLDPNGRSEVNPAYPAFFPKSRRHAEELYLAESEKQRNEGKLGADEFLVPSSDFLERVVADGNGGYLDSDYHYAETKTKDPNEVRLRVLQTYDGVVSAGLAQTDRNGLTNSGQAGLATTSAMQGFADTHDYADGQPWSSEGLRTRDWYPQYDGKGFFLVKFRDGVIANAYLMTDGSVITEDVAKNTYLKHGKLFDVR